MKEPNSKSWLIFKCKYRQIHLKIDDVIVGDVIAKF